MAQLERQLAWDGCANVRDLGGHPTGDGGTTRSGSIVRADLIRRLTDSGWQALVEYGVRTIVDLRFQEELDADPPAELPVEAVHVSLLGTIDDEYGTEIDALARAAGSVADGTKVVYVEFLERFRSNFARVIRAIAEAPDGAV
ncbi:MAG: tyrosine-protein phosphatase, partial [Actinomycetota bacterium]|nr:tyrosine-protein phosphatase [Actinomycetota bacterium]